MLYVEIDKGEEIEHFYNGTDNANGMSQNNNGTLQSNNVCCHPADHVIESRKLLRRLQNREAASRCRRRKMERINELQELLEKMHEKRDQLVRKISEIEAEIWNLRSLEYTQHPQLNVRLMNGGMDDVPMREAFADPFFFLPHDSTVYYKPESW